MLFRSGNFLESRALHPLALRDEKVSSQPSQLFGDVWEWTQSAYLPYPRFHAAKGAVGEYNGKFMCNQFVLRGARVRRRNNTSEQAIATFSRRTRAASFRDCGWRATRNEGTTRQRKTALRGNCADLRR